MTAHRHGPVERDEIVQSLVEPRAAARRDGEEAGVFYDDAYKPDDGGPEAGLIAGSRTDPVLVCGVGYPLLSDLAVGTVVAYHVARLDIPGVAVADASHTPIATFQTLAEGEYHTAIVVGAEKRGDGVFNDGTPSRNAGAIHEFGPDRYDVPSDEELVKRVGESAMGSNTVQNVLLIADAFDSLPEATRAVTVEVGYDSWGMNVDEFTDPVEMAFDDVFDRVIDLVDDALEREDDADTSGSPLENDRVNQEAIAHMDEDVRETITGLPDGVVAGDDR